MNPHEAKKFANEINKNLPTLDLHLCRPDEVEIKVDQFLYQCVNNKLSEARIITGIGSGYLKKKVLTYLMGLFLAEDLIECDGEIVVILRGF